MYVSYLHKCIKIKYKTVNMYEYFLCWKITQSHRSSRLCLVFSDVTNCSEHAQLDVTSSSTWMRQLWEWPLFMFSWGTKLNPIAIQVWSVHLWSNVDAKKHNKGLRYEIKIQGSVFSCTVSKTITQRVTSFIDVSKITL